MILAIKTKENRAFILDTETDESATLITQAEFVNAEVKHNGSILSLDKKLIAARILKLTKFWD